MRVQSLILISVLLYTTVSQAVVETPLDFIIVNVNDQRLYYRPGDVIKVVRGDTFLIERVALRDAILTAPGDVDVSVNVVGFARSKEFSKRAGFRGEGSANGKGARKSLDDREIAINTGSDLQPKFSLDGKGFVYRIEVATPSGPAGIYRLELVEPEFQYAEVMVNDRLVVARAGEMLTLAPTDKVRVRRLVTNVTDDRTVRFQIDDSGEIAEMQLFRGSNIFARIPLSQRLSSLP